MKSFSDRYSDSHHSTHETFADLVFCVLIVLVLFVMMLALEVSQRVRAELAKKVDIVEIEKVEDIKMLTPDEVAALSERLQKQQSELESQQQRMLQQQERIQELQRQAASQASTVQNKIAALNGEQRFTGLTQPASITLAYNYDAERFYFVPSKEVNHADTFQSGESVVSYGARKTSELVDITLRARKQRGYTLDEAGRLYQAFSQYREIEPTDAGYKIVTSKLGISYHTLLCSYITGNTESPSYAEELIVSQILKVYTNVGPRSELMHPRCSVRVNPDQRNLGINGVTLTPRDLRDILLALSGRGAMLDFEGYEGPAPDWLVEEVLTPTGYIGKTPKLPDAT